MRVERTLLLTKRMNRFVQELFTACNEDGTNFVLCDEGAYRCAKIISVYRDLFYRNGYVASDRELLDAIKFSAPLKY